MRDLLRILPIHPRGTQERPYELMIEATLALVVGIHRQSKVFVSMDDSQDVEHAGFQATRVIAVDLLSSLLHLQSVSDSSRPSIVGNSLSHSYARSFPALSSQVFRPK